MQRHSQKVLLGGGEGNCNIDILTIVHIEYKIINFDIWLYSYILMKIQKLYSLLYQKKKNKSNKRTVDIKIMPNNL